MQVWLQAPGYRLRIETQSVIRPSRDPVVDVGAELKNLSGIASDGFHFDSKKGRILNNDPDLFDRRHQKMLVAFPLEHRCKQFDQSRPPDRRFLVKPGAVSRDPHVDIAAKWRIPKLHGRVPLVLAWQPCRDRFQSALPCLRHCFPSIIRPPPACSHLRDSPGPAAEDSVSLAVD